MEPTYFAQYKGFDFQCSPERLHDGAFAPRLRISATYGNFAIELPVPVATFPMANPTAAAHQAFARGRRWVDDEVETASYPAPVLVGSVVDESAAS